MTGLISIYDAEEDIPPNMPKARVHKVSISMFVDFDLSGDNSTRRSQTWVLIFINKAPIYWYRKRWENIEASTFGAYLCATKAAVEMVEARRYKLWMFGLPIDVSDNMFCDNEVVYKNTITPDYVLKK